jgi:hypothetical protein
MPSKNECTDFWTRILRIGMNFKANLSDPLRSAGHSPCARNGVEDLNESLQIAPAALAIRPALKSFFPHPGYFIHLRKPFAQLNHFHLLYMPVQVGRHQQECLVEIDGAGERVPPVAVAKVVGGSVDIGDGGRARFLTT